MSYSDQDPDQSAVTLITASTPSTLVYQYGCRLDRDAEAIADIQFREAHRLYNNVVAKIREIVQGARDYCNSVAPAEAHPIQANIEALNDAFAAARAADDEPLMTSIATERSACWKARSPIMDATRKAHRTALTERFYGRIKGNADSELHAPCPVLTNRYFNEWNQLQCPA